MPSKARFEKWNPLDGIPPSSPREKALVDQNGANIGQEGRARRNTYDALPGHRRVELAESIGVTQDTLKDLVDDAGIAISKWISEPPAWDVYSDPDIQKLVTAAVAFLKLVNGHSASGYPLQHEQSKDSSEEIEEQRKIWLRNQMALAPLMELINPSWSQNTRWDVRRALHVANTLSDKRPTGSDASGDDRDIIAQDRLVESWATRTGFLVSKATTGKVAPDPFFDSLLTDLTVYRPKSIVDQDNSVFPGEEISQFHRRVVKNAGIGRAVNRWLSKKK